MPRELGTKIGVRATHPGRATLVAQVEPLVKARGIRIRKQKTREPKQRRPLSMRPRVRPQILEQGPGNVDKDGGATSGIPTPGHGDTAVTGSGTHGTAQTGTTDPYPEAVPEFIQAWLLLSDANLETQERNLIVTALQGELNLQSGPGAKDAFS